MDAGRQAVLACQRQKQNGGENVNFMPPKVGVKTLGYLSLSTEAASQKETRFQPVTGWEK